MRVHEASTLHRRIMAGGVSLVLVQLGFVSSIAPLSGLPCLTFYTIAPRDFTIREACR